MSNKPKDDMILDHGLGCGGTISRKDDAKRCEQTRKQPPAKKKEAK